MLFSAHMWLPSLSGDYLQATNTFFSIFCDPQLFHYMPPTALIPLRITHNQPFLNNTNINILSDKYIQENNTLHVLMIELNIPR